MSSRAYVITGDITLDNFNQLYTQERGIIWRGYTHEYEMIPSAANYDKDGKKTTDERTEPCHPLAEIKRIAENIYSLNKLKKYPFEIPLLFRQVLFSAFYQPEDKLFKEMEITKFPHHSLAQAMSIVQHEFGGTSLLDFSTSKDTALYFAIGKEETAIGKEKTMDKDSHIFGMSVPDFETQKNHLECNSGSTIETFSKTIEEFDLIYPSYFMNDKIAHQEGVFLHQRFKISKDGCLTGDKNYQNIIKYFDSLVANGGDLYEKISIDDFLRKADQEKECGREGRLPILYLLLKVPAKVKPELKAFLDSIGKTKEFMMNTLKDEEGAAKESPKSG